MKEKIVNIEKFVLKNDVISIILIITIITFVEGFCTQLSISDELWNFSNIYKMYDGGLLYNSDNTITTPIFWLIGLTMFKIFGANFFVFRIYNVIIFTLLFTELYLIFKKINLGKKISAIIVTIMNILSISYVTSGANYNVLVIVMELLGIINLLKNESNIKTIIKQGIILFLVIFTKQNVGVIYLLSLMIYFILQGTSSKKIVEKITKLNLIYILAGVLSILALLIMKNIGNLGGFVNYAIMGIGEFSSKNANLKIITIANYVLTSAFIILLVNIVNMVKPYSDKEKNNVEILTIFAITNLFIMYPLANSYHVFFALLILVIDLTYIIFIFIENNTKYIKWKDNICKKIISINVLIVIFLIGLSTPHIIKNFGSNNICSQFYGAEITGETINQIKEVDNYMIEQQYNNINVIILSQNAALYNIPLKRKNGKYDLPFLGNLGKEGEEGLIMEISKMTHTQILIVKDEKDMHGQESKKVRKYIIDNLNKVGEIQEFYIYQL